MSNLVELLLKSDAAALKIKPKEFKIKRLSEALGQDVFVSIGAVSFDRLETLRENHKDGDFRLMMALEGMRGVDLGNSALREKLGIDRELPKKEVLKKILTPGEIDDIYLEISRMSGYGGKTVEEVKKK